MQSITSYKLRCKSEHLVGLWLELVEMPPSEINGWCRLLRLAEPPRLRQRCEREPQRNRRHLVVENVFYHHRVFCSVCRMRANIWLRTPATS